jgi:MFS family permease
VPFGILADQYGRILVCAAGIVGVTLGYLWLFAVLYFYETLPFNLIYAYPLFFCLGGGAPVIVALILAIITDAAPKEIR